MSQTMRWAAVEERLAPSTEGTEFEDAIFRTNGARGYAGYGLS